MLRTCTIAVTLVSFALAQTDQVCPGVYTLIGGKCLFVEPFTHGTNVEARFFCENFFGDLVNITSLAMYEDIVKYIDDEGYQTTDFWIGGSDLPYWAANISSSSYYAQEPKREEVEQFNCLQLDHIQNMSIVVADCDEMSSIICEDLRVVDFVIPA